MKSSESEQRYDISELESLTTVPRRTIHFYVKEGLLPPPDGLGRSASYNEHHRLRLELIKLLKASTHLRLAGIREIIEPLALSELRERIRELAPDDLLSAPPPGVAEDRPLAFADDATLEASESPIRSMAPDREHRLRPLKRLFGRKEKDIPPADTWKRIRVTDQLEIHFQPVDDPEFTEELRRLVAYATRAFTK